MARLMKKPRSFSFFLIERYGIPYLYRWYLVVTRRWESMLHHIVQRDEDKHLHNHPWEWAWSFVLWGWYDEEYLPFDQRFGRLTYIRRWKRWSWRHWPGEDYHRIVRIAPRGVWTLFITGRRVRVWGFWENFMHIPFDIYLQRYEVPS